MTNFRNQLTLAAIAVSGVIALTACGDAREESAAARRDTTTSSTTPPTQPTPYASDRVTADASRAAARAGADAAPRSDAPPAADKSAGAADAAADAALTARVKAALMAEPGIESLQIDVDTANRRVTLNGEVDTPEKRQRALEVARGVDGVQGVVDRLAVKR